MILEAFDEIYRDGIISELEFYKKKVILLERPDIYINKYLAG
jgi:predicted metallo-beta-lactamase superfamily hydrolase